MPTPAKTAAPAKAVPAKAAPAKAAPTDAAPTDAAPAAAAPPALNLAAVKPAPVAVPVGDSTPGRTARDNSIVEGWVRELDKTRPNGAKISKEARAVTVPAANFAELRTRLNQAAAVVKCGISLTAEFTHNGKTVKQNAAAKLPEGVTEVTVIYVTMIRKQRKAKPVPATVPADTPASENGNAPASENGNAPADTPAETEKTEG